FACAKIRTATTMQSAPPITSREMGPGNSESVVGSPGLAFSTVIVRRFKRSAADRIVAYQPNAPVPSPRPPFTKPTRPSQGDRAARDCSRTRLLAVAVPKRDRLVQPCPVVDTPGRRRQDKRPPAALLLPLVAAFAASR